MPDEPQTTAPTPGSQPAASPPTTPPASQPGPARPIPPVEIKIPKINIVETQGIIANLEKMLQTRVMCYFVPPWNSINQTHADVFLDHLRRIGPQDNLALVVISDGGDSSASLRIATIVRDYCKTLTAIVPSRCASAATVLSLSADKIIMCPSGYLTAIDTKLMHELNPKGPDNRPVPVSVDQVRRILKFLDAEGPAVTNENKEGSYRTLFKYIHPITIGEIDRVSSRTIMVATMMMKMHPKSFENEEKIKWIAQHLYNDYPEHGFPILYPEAKEIGLPVEKAPMEMTDVLRSLVNYYDSGSIEATTHFSEGYFHRNALNSVIESTGVRTAFRVSLDRRMNQTIKQWQTENDISSWVNIIPPKSPTDKFVIQPLEKALPEDASRPVSTPSEAPLPEA